jgi:hypothetical protein
MAVQLNGGVPPVAPETTGVQAPQAKTDSTKTEGPKQQPSVNQDAVVAQNEGGKQASKAIQATDNTVPQLDKPEAAKGKGKVVIGEAYSGPVTDKDYVTAGGTKMTTVPNASYNPNTTPKHVVPKDAKLYKFLITPDKGFAKNIENMDKAKVKAQITKYAKDNPDVLKRLGITDIKKMNPKQAIMLASQIAQDISTYNHAAVAKGADGKKTAAAKAIAKKMDAWGLEKFFQADKNGVCRNYSEMVQGLFGCMKEMQSPKSESKLNNCYVKQPSSDNHAWNALYTVQPDGSVQVTQVDATWNDNDKPGETNGTDYTIGNKGIRHYNRMKQYFEKTGKRPLKTWQKTWDNGEGWDCTAMSGKIGMSEVKHAGGIAKLSDAIDALPEPLKVDAYKMLDTDVRAALKKHRKDNSKSELKLKHPKGN